MLPACFDLSERVFPDVRAQAARELVARGWTQSQIGDALQVSQAMVSKYLTRPPADDALVLRLVEDLVTSLVDGRHDPALWCAPLAVSRDPAADAALKDLLAAETVLLRAGPLDLVPQIGMNLARALPGATTPEHVLAYPGRLVEAAGRILRPAPAIPGGSQHLARCLLALQRHDPGITALASVRGGADVRAAAWALGWDVAPLPAGADVDARFAAAVAALAPTDAAASSYPVLHDAGAVGIEPCLYIAAADAAHVVRRILDLHDQVKT